MKITIITITYNCQETIEKTILSVINQPVGNIEYILIDGASSDGTMNIVKKYKRYFAKVISEKDRGISDAFNKGISFATGDIIGLVNSGDFLLPDTTVILNEHYNTHYDIFYGNTIIYDVDNKEKYVRECKELSYFKYELPFIHQSCFITKKAYKAWGGYSLSYKYCMDYELLLKMYLNGAKFKYINANLSEFIYDGISYKQPFKTLNEDIKIAKMYGLSSFDAMVFRTKYITRVVLKRTLSLIGLWNFISNFTQKKAKYV